MRFPNPGLVPAFVALLAAAPAAAQTPPVAADPDGGWTTYLEIKKLSSDFAADPERATMSGPSAGWTFWPKAPALPPELTRRVFVNESFLLVDVDSMGKAAGCRPLRASALPRLDAESCKLLLRPGYYLADLIPPTRPRPPEQAVVGVRWQRVDPATARRNAARTLPAISISPPPGPEKEP